VLLGLIRAREDVRGDRCRVCEHTKLVDDLRSRNVNVFGAAEKQYVLRDPRRHVGGAVAAHRLKERVGRRHATRVQALLYAPFYRRIAFHHSLHDCVE
jgi:hypothetical protein